MAATLEGADTLARTLGQAADKLDDLAGMHRDLGALIVKAAGPLTPRRTGALAGATTAVATADTTIVGNPLRYAAPVHALVHPWLAQAAADTEPRQLAAAEKHIQTILDTVKGI